MHLKVSFEWISFLFYWAMREKLDLVLVFKTSVKNFPLIYICLKCSTAYNFDITLTKVERYSKIVKKKSKKIIHGFSFDFQVDMFDKNHFYSCVSWKTYVSSICCLDWQTTTTVDQILLQYGNFLGYNITLRTLNPSIDKTQYSKFWKD